jgi:phosphohistidine phosphatase
MESSGHLDLWILRHAKAAENGPDGDMTRPLTKKGRRQAELVREHLENLESTATMPRLVICSPAVRARETAEAVMPALNGARIYFDKGLYALDADGVIEVIEILAPDETSIMIVGHNPTLLDLCVMLAERSASEKLEEEGLPTGTLVGLSAEGASSWDKLSKGTWSLVHRFVPKAKD